MAAPIRIVHCLAVSLILLQLQAGHCQEAEQLLQKLDKLEGYLVENTNIRINDANDYGLIPFKLKRLHRIADVKKLLTKVLIRAKEHCMAEQSEVRKELCCSIKRFQQFLKSTTPANELTDFAKQPQFLQMLDRATGTQNGDRFKVLRMNGDKKVDESLQPTEELPNDLHQWKKYVLAKLSKSTDVYKTEMKSMQDEIKTVINTLYDAVVVWTDVQVEMKSDQHHPDLKEKEALVMSALGLKNELGCLDKEE